MTEEIVFLLRLIAATLLGLTAVVVASFVIWVIRMPNLEALP